MNRWSDWEPAYQELRTALVRAQAQRNTRRGVTESGELGWVVYERQVMLDRVNLIRSRRGLGHVEEAAILAAEGQAVGHHDYTQKYAIGCADIAAAEATP